jgi:hypothetical protein
VPVQSASSEAGGGGGKGKGPSGFSQSSSHSSSSTGHPGSSAFHHCHSQHGSESPSCRAFASRAGAASAAANKPAGPHWAEGTHDQRFVDGRSKAKKWF